ncbi:MAG: hypothetical protein P8L46_01850 [Acidimicrobiales bacterium]|nr:hypothetical protein [Acidimicrobiales bacterium]MDG2216770.1 hypothetical protein [Acidimicrobiales bacterium]
MELRSWITGDLMSLNNRVENGVLNIIPPERMAERVDDGGIAPVYALWHAARHQDVAVNSVLRGTDQVLTKWGERVGATEATWRGLAEAEDLDLVPHLAPRAVGDYYLAVIDETLRWVADADLSVLDTTPDSTAALAKIGTPTDQFDWLYAMWDGKPGYFFLAWEAVGHGYNHLGELVAVRNRMGLSPF